MMRYHNVMCLGILAMILHVAGCASTDLKPVDIYPEDTCAQCRMAVSERAFASEIITVDREVFKFDDLGCFETFREKNPRLNVLAMFVSDYESKSWIPYEKSVIVRTGIRTPMGSGQIAFADTRRAGDFAAANPPEETASGGCGSSCCSAADEKP